MNYQLIIDSLENTLGLIPTHKAHPKPEENHPPMTPLPH
jgi:hypothetical protein